MHIYITDKTGAKFWNTSVSAEFSLGERNNMRKRLDSIKSHAKGFEFIDADTAVIVTVGEYADMPTDDIFAALNA